LQYSIIQNFILPFVLVFTLIFAILLKVKLIGEDKQINAIVSAVIALLFVSFAGPKVSIANFMIVLVFGLVIIFVGLLLWGFGTGHFKDIKTPPTISGWVLWVFGAVVLVAVVWGFLWAAGYNLSFDQFFGQSWSSAFWSNVVFIGVIAAVIAVVLRNK
jgi:hypothetical protein